MTAAERERYDAYVKTYKKRNYSSIDDVKRIIIRDLRYKKMQLVNAELMLNIENQDADFDLDANEVFVFAQFLKPGKQVYSVCFPDKQDDL